MPAPRLFLIDAFGFIFRAFHARARSGAPPMRTSKGLSTEAIFIFHNMLRRITSAHKPDYIAVIFESAGKTFREETFPEYKANREAMPQELAAQIPYVRQLLESQNIPVLQFEGYEADDVIGAISHSAPSHDTDVVIVSSDKDMLQLVNERVRMLNPMKDDIVYDIAGATEFMGVTPGQIPDLLALKGDPIDNIPGAPGIGEKGAREILQRFSSVEDAIENAAGWPKKTHRESLTSHKDQILMSKKLATIDRAVPIEWNLEDLAVREPDRKRLRELYRELEFFSLIKELGSTEEDSAGDWAALERDEDVRKFIEGLSGEPVGVVLSRAAPGELPLEPVMGLATTASCGRAIPGRYFGLLAEWLADGARLKLVHDLKSFQRGLADHDLQVRGAGRDLMLEAYLLYPDSAAADLNKLADRHLYRQPGPAVERQAAAIIAIAEVLSEQLALKREMEKLYREIELPLASVLARMEQTGIRVETSQLSRLSARMDIEIQRLTEEIHGLAGHPFNVNSPQQLAKVLFEEMNLPAPVRYGKGRQISTSAEVLEELVEIHPIASKVLEYRQLAKLKGTYVDALPQCISSKTDRLHTTFHQIGAATGRLSSSDPNLQNIPIRTELGREIRAAFVPEPGWKMVVADYSQIELRLLAHFSGDPLLTESFQRGEDIHTRTACEVFGTTPAQVTAEMRRNAKAVNFGIVYGQTPFGLSVQLGIPRQEAEHYIRNYFERYRGVRKYIDETIAEVRRTGIARTMFGRERPIPDMQNRNPAARGFAERTAVNTPLQGTAADLIKIAMIRVDRELEDLKTRMLLQVHDELVLESPPEEAAQAAALVKRAMEDVVELNVPLVVETGIGDNWRDAK
jgi:DNA polymerase-1